MLDILARRAMTYDGLRAELRTTSHELDAALQNLDRSKDIKRSAGRILINNGLLLPAAVVAEASIAPEPPPAGAKPKREKGESAMAKKHCKRCDTDKPAGEFGKNSAKPDGLQGYCKACVSDYGKRRGAPKNPKASPAPKPARAPAAAKELNGDQQLAILETGDGGVRIGYLFKDGPFTRMPISVDLSAEQLDELVAWRTSRA